MLVQDFMLLKDPGKYIHVDILQNITIVEIKLIMIQFSQIYFFS